MAMAEMLRQGCSLDIKFQKHLVGCFISSASFVKHFFFHESRMPCITFRGFSTLKVIPRIFIVHPIYA